MTMEDHWDPIDASSIPDSLVILVVDHSSFIRARIKEILAHTPVKVIEAIDGVAAQQIIASTKAIHFVVCELNVPGLDGIALLESVNRKNHPLRNVPFAIMSTELQLDKILLAKKLGAVRWLQKPLVSSELLELIHSVMSPLRKAG